MNKTIWNEFSRMADKNSEKCAIISGEDTISYGTLKRSCEMLGARFQMQGICRGMHVGVLLAKSIDYAVSVFALMRIGAVAVPLSTYYSNQDLLTAIESAELEKVVSNASMCAKMSVLEQQMKQKLIIVPHWSEIGKLENTGPETPGEECLFLMTSGSTGKPKIAMIRQDAMVFRLDLELLHFGLTEHDSVLISTPVYHSLGIRMLLMGLYSGMTVVLSRGFTPAVWLKEIQTHRITYTITVPAQIAQILEMVGDRTDEVREQLRSIRIILSTSAYLPGHLKQAFGQLISGRFINFIASSETEFIAWSDCGWDDPNGDLLGIPFPYVDIRMLQDDQTVPQGQIGEIVCSSRQLFHGYFQSPELTEQAFWGRYYRTGDLGFFDEKGRIHFAGRKKSLIICSGVNIVPRDVEQAVLELQGVEECVAFGIPHKKCGEILAVLVAGNVTQADVRLYCLKHLAVHQQPRKIFLTDRIPRNEMGKIAMDEIKKRWC